MTREQAIAFFIFSVAAAGTPGPSNVLLTATGAQVGVRRGLPCLLGVGLGMADDDVPRGLRSRQRDPRQSRTS